MRWQDKLTEEELAHVREWCGGTLAEFKKARGVLLVEKAWNVSQGYIITEPCRACRRIAKKLGIE
jgi:hypothetical protein